MSRQHLIVMPETPDHRAVIRKTFMDICAQCPKWTTVDAARRDTLVRHMERSCFEVTIKSCTARGVDRLFSDARFLDCYSQNCARVLSNLDAGGSVGSDYLIKELLDGRVDAYDVATLYSTELCPNASVAERKEIELRRAQKVERKVSRIYTCHKCGDNRTVMIEYQARAADEASTWSIKCITCDYVWRR